MSPPLSRVLYIDDDAALCRLIVRSLARKGFDVTSACSGPDGVALVERERFDVIAVDHYMPGRDGIATLEDLMAIEDCPPVVYVTGTDEGKIAVAALKSGAVDYIVKSADEDFLDLLASTFAQVVAQEDLRRARDRAEADLRATNQRLEALLREVNHRVANNLQMVMSFVGMQANAIAGDLDAGGAREVLRKTQARIATIAQINRRLYSTGELLQEMPLGSVHESAYGAKYYHLHRADLHAALAATVRELDPAAIVLDSAARHFSETRDSVTVQFASGATASGDLLIGADGIKSAVRSQIVGATQAEFTGYVSWRAIVPSSRLPPARILLRL